MTPLLGVCAADQQLSTTTAEDGTTLYGVVQCDQRILIYNTNDGTSMPWPSASRALSLSGSRALCEFKRFVYAYHCERSDVKRFIAISEQADFHSPVPEAYEIWVPESNVRGPTHTRARCL